MAKLKLDAEMRQPGTIELKKLRATGVVPVVVYGRGVTPLSMQVNARSFDQVLRHGGSSQLVEVEVQGGGKHNVLVREVQRHPVNHRLMHADFYAVRMDEKQLVSISIVGHGKPLAASSDTMVLQTHESITVEALPNDLPAVIEVDLTNLSIDHPITVGHLPKLAGVTYMSDEHDTIFMMASTVDAAADAADAAAAAEPEVVKKGKTEEEA